MWLITAIGPVHGQNKFTFALQQGSEYIVGRDESCDIRYESKHVRPREGTLVVDHWDPTQPTKPPSLKWRLEPKKSGAYGTIKTLGLIDLSDIGSIEREDYEITEIKDKQGCYLEEGVNGIELVEGMWFVAEWRDLIIQYDKFKAESDEVNTILRQYCIGWTQSFDTTSRPTIVLSAAYRSNVDCNYAVCFAIRILLPSYLHAIINRLKACWKKMADSQDSFALPDQDAEQFQPDFETTLQATRKDRKAWLPDKSRETMFKGWKIMGLRGRTQSAEKRYLIAMGADYQDMDVLTKPLSTAPDFADRIAPWLSYVDSHGGREQAIVVWFSPVKTDLQKKGIDYTAIVTPTCHRLKLYHSHGGILWASVNMGSVQEYLTQFASNVGQDRISSSVPNTQFTVPDIPHQPQSSQVLPTPGPSQAGASTRPDFIPSTFPDETERGIGRTARSPSAESRPSRLQRRTRQGTSPLLKERTPEPETVATVKKPLRRRAGKPVDFTTTPESPPRSHDNTEDETSQPSQPLFSQASFVQDSLPAFSQVSVVPATQRTQTQSMVPDSIMPSQSLAPGRTSSRLKRRAGGVQPSLIEEIADTSINLEQSLKDEEKAADIRQLYEDTKTGSFAPMSLSSKRPRTATRISDEAESSATVRRREGSAMEVDDDTYGSRGNGRSSRTKRAASEESIVPPPAQRRRARSPSEEEEEVEHRSVPTSRSAKSEHISPVKSTKGKSQVATTSGPSKDEAFLQAIKKSTKARSAVDELDKVFNQLRIPKPNGSSAVVKANEWNASIPDYALLNDFDDDLRGNFIQIVRKDLFRRDKNDQANREVVRVEDGRPNFKKFKKKNIVRREPMQLALAGPTIEDAEMGEPYWPTQTLKPSRGRGRGQATQVEEEDEDMPLLPRSRKRLLGTQVNQDDDEPPSTSRSRQRSRVPDTQPSQSQTQTPRVSTTQRRTRAQSVLSEAESVATTTTTSAARSTRATGGRGKMNEPVVLEDSDEEIDEGLDWGTSTGTGTGPKSRGGRTTTGTATQARTGTGTRTLEGDDPPSTSGRRKTATTQASSIGTRGIGTQASQIGRRRLLPADDDDDIAFKGLGKKRRLG
uniref:Uncharacterized protein n=1 Tax=Kwoniella bestiolae CBS 10118 TaxID=1296100 RepID=A0A1B9G846_9TREE|nr:hypothetical protein I302_02034 [Kwoniella bestiolae CBS 10118]OCF27196.1 hypothetical protein I302_02034 [Kwoniella bestiolae CBS 10118]